MIELDYNPRTRKLRIVPEDKDLFDDLREHFSVVNEGATFAKAKLPKNRKRFVPDRKYIVKQTGYCAAGLYGEIEHWLHVNQITGVKYTDSYKAYIEDGFEYDPFDEFPNEEYKLRYYQADALRYGIKNGRGIFVVGTGGGKTLMCASLIESYYQNCEDKGNFKCLIVVPNIGLVSQTYKDFNEYGVSFSVTRWTGNQTPDSFANVTICNSAILVRRMSENIWVENVDLVLVDEVHAISNANKISDMISKIRTTHKYGFTGTLPLDKWTKWNVIGAVGPVIYEKTSKELRDEEYLANAEVRRLEISYTSRIERRSTNSFFDELDFIYENPYRNNLIRSICDKYPKNILILVNHIRHGEKLLEELQTLDRSVHFIEGKVEVEDREKVIEEMEAGDGVICIAISKIFSTGINIKNLHMVMFASGGKAFIRTVQSIGRGLRLHPTKTMLNIVDLCDNLYYSSEHAAKRLRIYDKEKIRHKTKTLQEHG